MKKTAFLILTGLLLSPLVFAKIPVVPVNELSPADRHERATEVILHIIKTSHYKKTILNDGLSSDIYDNYLESLDPNRNFFTQEDINRFEQYRFRLDDD